MIYVLTKDRKWINAELKMEFKTSWLPVIFLSKEITLINLIDKYCSNIVFEFNQLEYFPKEYHVYGNV